MSRRSLSYVERAVQCEHMALRVKDPDARFRFIEMAQKWRALARQADELGRVQAQTDGLFSD